MIIFLSKAAASSLKLRKLIDGQAVILYENDQIYNEELEKAKLDLDEFLIINNTTKEIIGIIIYSNICIISPLIVWSL